MGRLKGRGLRSRLGRAPSRFKSQVSATGESGRRRSKNWLNTARWQRLRKEILKRDQYTCQQTGVLLVGPKNAPDSPVVDHIVPHRGDADLFWDPENLQSVAKSWHDKTKQSMEKRGLV